MTTPGTRTKNAAQSFSSQTLASKDAVIIQHQLTTLHSYSQCLLILDAHRLPLRAMHA